MTGKKSTVVIMPDEHGNKIRVSNNNPDYGHIRLQQNATFIGSNNFVKTQNRSTLVHGKVEELQEAGFADMESLTGQLVIKEQINVFSSKDSDRDLKMAGDTGIICKAVDMETGEIVPIYRKTFFTSDMTMTDILVSHVNSDEIREANGFEAKEENEVSKTKSTRRTKKEETSIDETVEETVPVEIDESDDNSFEL
tara:strand:- start:713 stop:1300 length:588 start_codon:yes stop_codon:yes gene_type:complete